MLRIIIGVIGALCLIAGIVLLALHEIFGVQLLIIGALICISLVFEGRYRTARTTDTGPWQPTGEKFIDPSTGKHVEVDYDPATGERRYREH
jgi:hypothetical protein